jgi:peptidyl-prolyl cis-trans isomerase C
MSRPVLRPLAFAALAALALGAVCARAEDKVLAKINGEAITEKDVEIALPDVTAEYPNLDPKQQQEITLDFLIEMRAAAQKAKAEKVDQGDAYKRRLAYVRDRVLMQELLAKVAKEGVTEAKMKAFYDEQVKQIKPVEEVRARHVLVETEDAAKALLKRIKGGEDFAKIAKEASKDPGSGAEGGDLGYFTKDRMVPEFAEAAFGAKVGDVVGPIKSQFGFHVIKVEDRRTKPVPAFEQVKDRIAAGLAGKAQGEYIKTLREAAKVEKTAAPAEKPAEKPADKK